MAHINERLAPAGTGSKAGWISNSTADPIQAEVNLQAIRQIVRRFGLPISTAGMVAELAQIGGQP